MMAGGFGRQRVSAACLAIVMLLLPDSVRA